ncbi:hypothetical protein [Sinorhizobium fredii]
MADREKQAQSEESRKEIDTDASPKFDPWEAEFRRDFRRNEREFDF